MLIRELPAGKGFANVVFLPLPSSEKPALVMELKYDRTAYAAIQQIKERHYIQAPEGYTGEILLVGINYDQENKNKPHNCVIERAEKKFPKAELQGIRPATDENEHRPDGNLTDAAISERDGSTCTSITTNNLWKP